MKISKIVFILLILLLLTGCDFSFGSNDEVDVNLYHLTFSSNITLTEEQKSLVKATYGYGEASTEVKEGVRPTDEIDDLIKAGASSSDIEKAGKRQDDGSYYFFSADPIYLEAPKVEGYKFDGFYNKKTGELEDRASMTRIDDEMKRSRWNMDDEDVELEARYNVISYDITFDIGVDGMKTNPNVSINHYNYNEQKDVVLLDPELENEFYAFKYWAYQDLTFDGPDAPWIEIKDGVLPIDYELDYMRITAVIEKPKFKINFAFEKEIEYGAPRDILEYDDVVLKMEINSNLTTINGEYPEITFENKWASISKEDVIEIEYMSWLNIGIKVNEEYKIWKYRINDGEEQMFYEETGYASILGGDIVKDSIITFVLTNN